MSILTSQTGSPAPSSTASSCQPHFLLCSANAFAMEWDLSSGSINSRPDLTPAYARRGQQSYHKSCAGITWSPSCSSKHLLLFGLHTPMASHTAARLCQLAKSLAWGFRTKMLVVIFCLLVKHGQRLSTESAASKEDVMISKGSTHP